MEAPKTPPYYGDLHGGREEGLPPAEGARWMVDLLASIAHYTPDWVWEERNLPVRLWPISGGDYASAMAELGFAAGEVSGTIHLSEDESGYARVVVGINGAEVLRVYVDRPWEEIEGHPPGAEFAEKRTEDAPARMGKHLNWLQLRAEHWPVLAALGDRFVSFSLKE